MSVCVLRTVVMWLIALAIPVQGMAAVVVPPCPPGHHAPVTAEIDRVASASGDEARQGAAAANHSLHHGQHGIAVHGAAADPSPHADATAHDDAGHTGHDVLKCCSAVFTMAGLVAPTLATPFQAESPAPLHRVTSFRRGHTPDGLDRPPKRFLA